MRECGGCLFAGFLETNNFVETVKYYCRRIYRPEDTFLETIRA